MEISLKDLLQNMVDRNSSDLHLTVGLPPMIRIDRALQPMPGYANLDDKTIEQLIGSIVNEIQAKKLETDRELDFSFSLGERARFRANAFYQKGFMSAAFRMIPYKVPTLEQLNLPSKIIELCKLPRGFVLVTGATSQGKSTTLASMIDYINRTEAKHIITIEDPIEYVFQNEKSVIQQRELFQDTMSWNNALKSSLREDPDVVLVGEMRDYETISNTVTLAETGHLVFATLHTNSAAQSLNRLIDVFPETQQAQVRTQLADTLQAVLSQRLVPSIGGGMVPAVEILIANSAVRNTVREGKTHLIDNIINTNIEFGMTSLERSLAELVNTGKIDLDTALRQTVKPDELKRLVKK